MTPFEREMLPDPTPKTLDKIINDHSDKNFPAGSPIIDADKIAEAIRTYGELQKPQFTSESSLVELEGQIPAEQLKALQLITQAAKQNARPSPPTHQAPDEDCLTNNKEYNPTNPRGETFRRFQQNETD